MKEKSMDPSLSNTEELLLICSQQDLSPARKKRAQTLIKEGIYWQRFLRVALKDGITVLIDNGLREISPSAEIPRFVFDRLKPACTFILAKTAQQHSESMNLLRLFAERNIPAVPLKGLILSKSLYGTVAARGLSADYDLLIEEKNKESARILLEEAGYSLNLVEQIIKPWQYSFTKSKAMMVDLHWDISKLYQSGERIEGFWKGTRLIEESGVSYYQFEGEELLLYLSVQMMSSCNFITLRYVCDIHQLLHRHKDRLNWPRIIKKAKRWRLANSLYAVLHLSREFFDSDLPAQALKRLKPNFLKRILLNLFLNRKVILRNRFRRRLLSSFLRNIFFELIEAESVKDYFSIVFPARKVRDKDWTARIAKGLSALPGLLPGRRYLR